MVKKLTFLTVAFFFMIAAAMQAQVTTAGISGKVTDKEGAVIGATVVATHEPSGTTYGTVTNVDGRFNLNGMRVGGPYKVEVSFIGYQTLVMKDIQLRLGETENITVEIQETSIALNEAIIEAPRIVSKNSTITNITNDQLTKLPTINRSINDFTKLSPYSNGGSFAGRDSRYNNFTVDGASLNNNFGLSSGLPGGNAQPISLDAIEEISVTVSPYDVKFSNFTGAAINIVTKGGTNKFKGSAYSFLRPKSFTGEKVGDLIVPNARTRNAQTYGVTLGGAIIKNKLFFYLSGEIEKEEYPGITWSPSTDGKGDDKQKISRTTEQDLKSMSDFLKSNYSYDPGIYKDFPSFSSNNWKLMARLDWNINRNHKLMLRYNNVDSKNDQEVNSNSAPNPRGDSRIGLYSMAFSNSNYKFHNIVSTLTGELNSTINANLSNKLLLTYTHIQDAREELGNPFPFVDIYDGTGERAKQYMTFGTELFTTNNKVINNVTSIVNNLSYTLNNHFLMFGASFEKQFFRNSFLQYARGYYRYASMDDFKNNKTPLAYALTYGYGGEDAPGAELNFGMGGLYAQDEWYVNDAFRLTYGLRLDMPFYFDKMEQNSAIAGLTFDNGRKIDVSKFPSAKVLLSPRLGFRWDIYNDRRIVVNGGTGVFTGLLPFVWFTNQPTNAGLIQNTVELIEKNIPVGLGFETDYKKMIEKYPNTFPSKAGNTVPGVIAFVDPEFKLPQVWRSSLGAEIKMPYDFNLSLNALYSRDVYNVVQVNINEKAPTLKFEGADDRSYYAKAGKYYDNRINNDISYAMMLANAKEKGYQYSLNATLSKRFNFGLNSMVSYTYSQAKDLSSNPGSRAQSAWSSNTAVGSLNNPGLSYSNFSIPHRIIANLSYELDLFNHSKTILSLFYSGYNTGRISYTLSNDINGDGARSDLMFVPSSKDELVFADVVDNKTKQITYSKDAQATDFWNYVEGNTYLSSRKGKYAERFGGLAPWINRFDFKIAQNFYANMNNRKYGIEVSLDILNAGNLLNSAWGVYKSMGLRNYDNVSLLSFNKIENNKPVYQVNAKDAEDFKSKSTWNNSLSTSSTWGMMLGVKVTF